MPLITTMIKFILQLRGDIAFFIAPEKHGSDRTDNNYGWHKPEKISPPFVHDYIDD